MPNKLFSLPVMDYYFYSLYADDLVMSKMNFCGRFIAITHRPNNCCRHLGKLIGHNSAYGFGTQLSVPCKIMINCPLLTSHNFLCDFAAPLRFWSPTILVICLSENRKEKACSTSRFQAILFLCHTVQK